MRAGRPDANQLVAGLDAGAVQGEIVGKAGSESHQVDFAGVGVMARHLGSLTAYQIHVTFGARLGDGRYHIHHVLLIELVHGNVVEEMEGHRSRGDDVVHYHPYEVPAKNPWRLGPVDQIDEGGLGADPVRAGHEFGTRSEV